MDSAEITPPGASPEDARARLLRVELDRMVSWLVVTYGARQVILFGSMAGGRIGAWSDLDLVVVKDTPLRFMDRIAEIIEKVRPRVGVDLLVYTPAEWQLVQERRFAREEILGRGRILHAA
ncbi:MAG: nucleotidyltransferase domain-containing protein [Opitutaceae bacterium]